MQLKPGFKAFLIFLFIAVVAVLEALNLVALKQIKQAVQTQKVVVVTPAAMEPDKSDSPSATLKPTAGVLKVTPALSGPKTSSGSAVKK